MHRGHPIILNTVLNSLVDRVELSVDSAVMVAWTSASICQRLLSCVLSVKLFLLHSTLEDRLMRLGSISTVSPVW